MKIVILDKKTVTLGDVSLASIEALGEVISYDLTSQEQVIERISDAEAVLCNKIVFTKEIIESSPNLKYIGLFATGYNNIDLEAAKEKNIVVCNAPAYSTNAVAQHVFALILHFMNQIPAYHNSVCNKAWIHSDTFAYFPYAISELADLTIGILGFGSIGQRTAAIAKAFGMNVIVHTRTVRDGQEAEFVSLDELFTHSDIVSLHCPLTETTAGLICSKNLAKMKKSAILINTSRGGVVKEQDLADALNQGVIAGAGLDVLTMEPMEENNPLFEAKNCIITPHVAWAPKQTRERLIEIVTDNLTNFINGNPIHIVS